MEKFLLDEDQDEDNKDDSSMTGRFVGILGVVVSMT